MNLHSIQLAPAILALSLFFLTQQIFGETGSSKEEFISKNGNIPIESFQMRGLKKTRESVIRDCIRSRRGELISTFDEDQARQNIMKLGFIRSVSFDYRKEGDRAAVIITMTERLTLIGLPIFTTSGDSFTAGIIGMDSNLFGYNRSLMVGGFYSSSGWTLMSIFADPGSRERDFVYRTSLFAGDTITENRTIDDDIYQEYSSVSVNFLFSPGYKFDKISVYADLGYHTNIMDKGYDRSKSAPDSEDYIITGTTLEYANLRYTGLKMTGTTLSGQYRNFYSSSDQTMSNRIKGEGEYSFIPFWKLITSVNITAAYSDAPDVLMERIAGQTSFQSLHSGYIAMNSYAGTSISWEAPVYSNSSIALSCVTFGEGGFLSFDENYGTSYTGFGGGTKLYLKGVAFPAIGFYGAYNTASREYVYTFSVGMM